MQGISILWKGQKVYFNVLLKEEFVVGAYFSKYPLKKVVNRQSTEYLKNQLEQYFSGYKVNFNCKILPKVSFFVLSVLEIVKEIPYGNTRTYSDIAKKLNTSPRAVGQALKRNPIPVIIPCHRVVAKNGIGGFSYGVELKKALLKLEGLNY